ncbi:MAG: MFS transporter [Paludibacteraceae bacterium]|nr:MFS transporter [Paludibacteraceae bacterium]
MKQNIPSFWVPTLYFAEGLPYVLVMTVSVILYKNLGVSNAEIAFYTSWLYLPWVIKPLWSPFVDLLQKKRFWILSMQLLIGAGLAAIAFTIPTTNFFQITLALFWLLAFSSATHDVAADGFYMLALSDEKQSFYVGIRNTFYRVAMITGQGLMVMVAGLLSKYYDIRIAWSITFLLAAGIFIALSLYHFFVLPKSDLDVKQPLSKIRELFVSFFQKKGIITSLSFLLLYRLGEAQLAKIASPFLLDNFDVGGLALSTEQVGLIYGTIGVVALLVGGIVGGVLASRYGLKRCLWSMVLAMNLPNLVYVYLAMVQPQSFALIAFCVGIEQLGDGFGFTAFTLYLIQLSDGEFKTAHYAIGTGIMALGMMIPGMFAGYIQESLGYTDFFIWICICTLPGIFLASKIKILR